MMTIRAIVKLASRKPRVDTMDDGTLMIYVRELAIKGKANNVTVSLLSKHFGITKTRITLTKGTTSRYKTFEIN